MSPPKDGLCKHCRKGRRSHSMFLGCCLTPENLQKHKLDRAVFDPRGGYKSFSEMPLKVLLKKAYS